MGIYRSLVQDVLTIPVSISLPRLRHEPSRPLSRGKLLTFVLDSGSTYCSLTPQLIREIGLPFRNRVSVSTQLRSSIVLTYDASLAFPTCTLAPFPRVVVAALPMPRRLAAYDGVIGRRLLERWETFYSGLRRRLVIRDYRSFWGWLFS